MRAFRLLFLGLGSLAVFAAGEVEAQPRSEASTWRWESPLPMGSTLRDLTLDSEGVVWAAGELGTLGTLSSDGRTWTPRAVAGTDDLRHVAACEGETVAVGMSGFVARVGHEVGAVVREEHLAGAETLTGVACVGRIFLISSGAGALWVSENAGPFVRRPAPHPLFALHIVGSAALGAGPGGAIARTSDQGRTWTTTAGLGYNIFSFAGTGAGIVGVGEHGAALRSTDGGMTWSTYATGVSTDLLDVSQSSSGEIVAVGAVDNLRGSGSATAFTTARPLGEPYFASIAVPGGWLAVGIGGRIATRRGSAPFQMLARPLRESLSDLWSDGRIRIVVGEHGLLARGSVNGPLRRVTIPTSSGLHSVMLNRHGVGLAVGESGVVLRTTNGGVRWAQVTLAATRVFTNVWLDDAGHALILGERGQRFVSSDAGQTWESVSLGDHDHFLDLAERDGRLWLTGSGGRIERSDDFGRTWIADVAPAPGELQNLFITERGTMVVSERPGRVYWRGPSGGWNLSDLNTPDLVSRIGQANGILYAVTSQGGVFSSRDEGHHWSSERPFTHEVLNFVRGTPDGRLFIGGYWGTLVSR